MKSFTIAVAIIILGISLVWLLHTPTQKPTDDISVVVVGAGAAGLSAGAELEKFGIDYTIIEASNTPGGRLKESTDFTDFPIDLGAEWIHEDPTVLDDMAGQPVLNDIDISVYDPRELYVAVNGELEDWSEDLIGYKEWKFKNSTWFNFFETYITPKVVQHIVYNQPVTSITYSDDQVTVQTAADTIYVADFVIVTVPINILKREYINFTPPLPEKNVSALNNIEMSPGLKVFMSFDEQFYPEMFHLEEQDPSRPYEGTTFYDATFDKGTDANVLGILIVGEEATPYIDMSEQEVANQILSELDEVFDGNASTLYQNHIVQNWSQEPFIRGTYTTDTTGLYWKTLSDASSPVDDRIFFASAAYDSEQQGTVPGAWRTAVAAVEELLNSHNRN